MAPPLLQQKYAFLLQMCGERGERRSALREKHSSLLSTAMRQHSSCDARTASKTCTLFCSCKTRARHRIPPTRHSASAQQRFHAVCLVLPRSDHRWKRPRGPPQRQRSAAERTLEAFSSAAAGGEANRLAGQTLGFGVKDTLTSRAAIHFSNALFVR